MAPFKTMQKGNGGNDPKDEGGCVMHIETNVVTLMRRQKQIEYGKSTQGYKNYLSAVPKQTRSKFQPRTPNKYSVCSRRSFDGQIKIWRLLLHSFDDDRSVNNATSDAGAKGEEKGTGKNGKVGDAPSP